MSDHILKRHRSAANMAMREKRWLSGHNARHESQAANRADRQNAKRNLREMARDVARDVRLDDDSE